MRLTVDGVVLFGGKIVLIRRTKPPFEDKLVLPGGHVEEDDVDLKAACVRELAEEIGLSVSPDELTLLTVLDTNGRDPRPGRRVSAVFVVRFTEEPKLLAGSDAAELVIRDLATLEADEVGFDHFAAITLAKNLC